MRAQAQTRRWWLESERADGAPVKKETERVPNVSALYLDGLPIFKPPYARVTAIDMNQGTTRWVSALGNGPRNHPLLAGLQVGPLGDALEGQSVLVTK